MNTDRTLDKETRNALGQAWHQNSAASSLDRWLDLREQQGWGDIPHNLPLLVGVFGASWYFTRYVFFRGPEIAAVIDGDHLADLDAETLRRRVWSVEVEQDPESALESLRVIKNEIMLQVLLADLQELMDQAEIEERLTILAEETLAVALRIYSHNSAPHLEEHIGVLGMGRMAGREMNFGSDLDLIFLYPGDSSDVFEQVSRLIRSLLRGIAMAAPAGTLYEVDMRLRPHGAAGVLVTSVSSFEEYHAAERDIWQRQLMTRCRPVVDGSGLASQTVNNISGHIYTDYDRDFLCREVRGMRLRVEDELGSPAGRYELKRGKGGVMDIDFITHFLQLANGAAEPSLQTASTRRALLRLRELDLLAGAQVETLLAAYDFLKRMEGRLRVFDMKAISAIQREPQPLIALARGMGYRADTDEQAAEKMLEDYLAITTEVRRIFDEVLPGES